MKLLFLKNQDDVLKDIHLVMFIFKGKILRVDLTYKSIELESPENSEEAHAKQRADRQVETHEGKQTSFSTQEPTDRWDWGKTINC